MQREHEQTLANQSTSKEKPEQSHESCVQEQQLLLSSFMEEKKDLEAERETVICMKDQLFQADANLRKQLHEHAVRMQAEAEEMARQKRELEHAKIIAAEIAVEVESSRRELDMYKNVFNRITPENQHEEKLVTAYRTAAHLPNFERSSNFIRLILFPSPNTMI
ncbi:hypothetical protein L7F22_024031 [Adiantum nelumboides]|nr:hypothetical protein [Adiantum nelumboides]